MINRDYYIDEVMKYYNVNKDTAKNLFIRILYGGDFHTWKNEYNIINTKIPFIDEFTEEFNNISTIIHDNNPNLTEIIKKNKIEKGKSLHNIKGSVTSYFLQEIEVRILELLYHYCVDKEYIVNNECVLAADGLMLMKKYINKDINIICEEFNNLILEKTGLKLNFLNKPFEQHYLNILDKSLIFNLPFKDYSSGILSDYFRMIYSDKFLYNNNKLYCYNGYYWLEEDKKSKLHNFIDEVFYKHLFNNIYKLIEEYKKNNIEEDNIEDKKSKKKVKDPELEKLLLFQKNILNLRKYRYRNELIEDICCKLSNNDIIFDSDPYLYAFNNKIYDLKTDNFIEPNYKQYIKTTCGYDYDNYYSNNKIKELDNLIDTILPNKEVKDYYLTILSSGLYGEPLEKIVIAQGEGGNGKSLLNELMLNTTGNYGYKLPSIILSQPIKDGGNPQLALLHNKRFVLAQEPEKDKRYSTSTLKELTGGSKLNARKLHSNDCDVTLKLTLINECNKLPLLDEVSNAIVRRLEIIPFISKFVEEHEYNDYENKTNIYKKNIYYKTDEFKIKYKQGLFDILKNYFTIFRNNNYSLPKPPKECKEKTNNYLACSDDIYEWFITIYEKDEKEISDTIKISTIHDIFISSKIYENMTKEDKRKYTLKYFNESIKTNIHLKNNYKEKDSYYNKIRYYHPYIIGYKQINIEDIPNIIKKNNLDNFTNDYE